MADRFEMRAADSDRERVAEILRDAHGEGRLSQDEMLARIEATYAARTYRDLDRLIADLPVPRRPTVGRARPASAPPAVRRGTKRRVARTLLTGAWWFYAMVVSLNVGIWLAIAVSTGDTPHFWPVWVAVPWGVVLAFGEAAYQSRQRS